MKITLIVLGVVAALVGVVVVVDAHPLSTVGSVRDNSLDKVKNLFKKGVK